MKVAVIGSRTLRIGDLGAYLPDGTTTIVTGGAKGIDSCAADYARAHGVRVIECLPSYDQFGRGAPLKRNERIIDLADRVLAFWNGRSRGTKHAIERARVVGKPVTVYLWTPSGFVDTADAEGG